MDILGVQLHPSLVQFLLIAKVLLAKNKVRPQSLTLF